MKNKNNNKHNKKIVGYTGHNKNFSKKKQVVELKCIEINAEGNGVAKYSGSEVIIPNMIKGEVGIIELTRRNGFYTGKIIKLLKKSSDRVKPVCEYYFDCGGCQLQHMSYKAQLKYKKEIIVKLMGKYGTVKDVLSMDVPYDYRNKAHFTFGEWNKKIISGFYKEYTHRLINIDRCIIQDKEADDIAITIRELMRSFKIQPFDEDTGRGFLRHILIRKGMVTGEIMLVLVVADHKFHSKNNFIKALLQKHPNISSIIMNINNKKTSMVLGDREKTLYGKPRILDELCEIKFLISAKSFYQINHSQTQILYNTAIDMAEFKGNETVIDAYSGIGTISLIVSKKVKRVLSVELNPDAIKDAIFNAKENNIKNVEFICDDAGRFMEKLSCKNQKADVVIMDPARAGSDERFLNSLVKLSPKKVIYISCNPYTQKRDIEYLVKNKYKVKDIQPVDMFSHSYHIENIVLLTR